MVYLFTATDPERIVDLVNAYPDFLDCYHDLIAFRSKPKELVYMFSEALREMDHNTELYMIEELQLENQRQVELLAKKDDVIAEKDRLIEDLMRQLRE